MKVTHLCLGCFYIDNYTYQENLLPKYHKLLGYDVEIIASTISFDENGNETITDRVGTYINEYGIKVTRLPFKGGLFGKIYKKIKVVEDLENTLNASKSDIIFIHGPQFYQMEKVIKYINRNKNIKVFLDNHADFSNSARNIFSKYVLHKCLWKRKALKLLPFVEKAYGVLPSRVEFLQKIYKFPLNKTSLLVMGADTTEVIKAKENIESTKKKYQIKDDEFIIVTGGKIDNFKKQTLHLMEAIHQMNDNKIRLIVFGSIIPELKEKINELSNHPNIDYIGWLDLKESYNIFSIANLVVFPGRHSVYWEQVAGIGIPMIVKYWDGTTHIDGGGNVKFLYNDTTEELLDTINQIVQNKHLYSKMKATAEKIKSRYSYLEIARKSINIE